MGFAKFMSSELGRRLRIVMGVALMVIGLFRSVIFILAPGLLQISWRKPSWRSTYRNQI